jgi:hypothetical protein
MMHAVGMGFTVETTTSHEWPWTWQLPKAIDTGLPAPVCPRLATHTASFLATYRITVSGQYDANTTAGAVLADLLSRVACSVQVASRRVMLDSTKGANTVRLSIALESLVRVHQANLVIMGAAFSDELQRRLGLQRLNTSLTTGPLVTVEREGLSYINDTRDAPIACPDGLYFSVNGTYLALPAHATAGPDCYDMLCVAGFTLDPATQHCIPTPVSSDIVWICVLIVLSVIIALSALICCVQLSLWKSEPEPVVFEPTQPDPQPAPEPSVFEDAVFEDSDERETYFRNIVAEVILDDYSAMMLEGEFSPRLEAA